MEKLHIDEILDHCKRKTEHYEGLIGKEKLEADIPSYKIKDNVYKEYWEHRQVAQYIEELKELREVLSYKVGDIVYVKTSCENVAMDTDYETGVLTCPFENDCKLEDCDKGQETDVENTFKTSIMTIWNNGGEWYCNVRGIVLDIPLKELIKAE